MTDFVRAVAQRAVGATDDLSESTSLLLGWYGALLDELPVAVFVKDLEGRYLVVNKQFVDEYNERAPVTRSELIGRTDYDFLPSTVAEVFDHKDKLVLAGNEIRGLEEQLDHADGAVTFYRTTKLAIRDSAGRACGLVGFSSGISEPVRVAEALAESERRYRLALRASRDGIFELDLANQEVVLSPRGARLLHLPVSNEPRPSNGLFHYAGDEEQAALELAIRDLVRDPSQILSFQYSAVLLDGERRTLRLEAAPVVENDRVTRIIGSVADVTDAVANENRLRELANHDDLTALGNRRALLTAVDEILETGVKGAALLYLDLDDFKLVNDALGHLAGDQMLVEVARRLRSLITASDVVARLGGDEFAVLLRPVGRVDRVVDVSAAVIESFAAPFMIGEVETYASVSIGAIVLDGYETSDDLIRDVDAAMYSAKRERVPIRFFEPDMHHTAASLRQLHSDVRRAVDGNEFHLAYQPLVAAGDHRVVSLEALLRWTPAGEMKPRSPSDFLPVLEETGQIIDVGAWVINDACRQLAEWRDLYGIGDLNVSVNLSRVQILHQGLVGIIQEALHRFGLPGSAVTFEVTETAIAADVERVAAVLSEIRELGATVAIDDFGVGQSCLSQLYDLPIDRMKIDVSFVRRITDATSHWDPVLDAILSMGHGLGMAMVAEGVETLEQAQWLAANGCDVLQGYYFDRPLTPLDLAERIVDGQVSASGADPNPTGLAPPSPDSVPAVPRTLPE